MESINETSIFIDTSRERAQFIQSRVDLCNFLNEEVKKLEISIKDNSEKLSSLVSKFSVHFNGDKLKPQYEILFNSIQPKSEDELSKTILNNFIKEYGLDMSDILNTMKLFRETVECIDLTSRNIKYCEVDLLGFTDDQKPKTCS